MPQNNAAFGKQFYSILKIWLGYLLLSKLALIFPHWKIASLALINYDLFFLIFLFATAVFFKARNNKYIFLNLAILALAYVSGLLVIFLGNQYALGNDLLQYYFWGYRKILVSIITGVTIIYIPIDYLYYEKKTSSKYLLTLFITLTISFLYYRNFFLSYQYLFIAENYYKLFAGHLGMNFLAIFFIMLYGYLFFYRDKPISRHVNLLVFSFLIFLSIDSLDNFLIYSRILLPNLSQLVLFINLVLFLSILIHCLHYLNTDFGQFYEDYRFSKLTLSLKLKKKTTMIEKYIFWLQAYFNYLPNRILFIILMISSILFFLYFYPYGYAKINFIILVLIMIIIFTYLNILTRRRMRIFYSNKK